MSLVNLKSEYPCFWFARYEGLTELNIPKCNVCGRYIKLLKDDDNIICRNSINKKLCNSIILNSEHCEHLVVPLKGDHLFEFNDCGDEILPFRNLPSKGMSHFGLFNIPKDESYAINLSTGEFILNGTKVGVSIIKPSENNNINTEISNKLPFYGDGGDLIQFKRATTNANLEKNTSKFITNDVAIESFNIGYKCKVNNLYVTAILSVETENYTPSFCIKYNEDVSK
jgi:hypothetical protein